MLYSNKSGCEIWQPQNRRSEIKRSKQMTCNACLAQRGRVGMYRELIAFAKEEITILRLLIPERFLCALSGQATKSLSSGLSLSSICSSVRMRPLLHSFGYLRDRLI